MTGKTNKEYLRQARALNRYLHKGIKHNRGTNLTPAIKRQITREYKKNKEYLDNPKAFKSVPLKGARLDQMKKNGYSTSKTRVFIPLAGADDIKIRRNTIQHIYADHFIETIIGDTGDILENFAEVFERKRPNQFVAGSFMGNGLFKKTTFDSYATFLNYMSAFQPKDAKDASDKQKAETKAMLIAQLHLVTIPKSWRTKLDTGRKPAIPLSKALERFNK